MSEMKKTLFEEIKNMPIKDFYACPDVKSKVLTNATDVIKTPEKDSLISLFDIDEKCDISSLSDFEYFRAFFELLPRFSGTKEADLANEEAYILQGKYPSLSSVEELWKSARDLLSACDGDYETLLKTIGVEKLHRGYGEDCSFVCVEKYNCGEETLIVTCDARSLPFVRPDPYHASLAEEKRGRGEPLSAEEKAILATQALYLLCANKGDCKLDLHLLADDEQTLLAWISYLKRLNVQGHVWVAADGNIDPDTLASLCAHSDDHLRIRLEIVLGKTDSAKNFEKRLSALSALYPIALWRFGGVITRSPLFAAGHMLARRVISDITSTLVSDYDDAVATVRSIFS